MDTAESSQAIEFNNDGLFDKSIFPLIYAIPFKYGRKVLVYYL